MKRFSFSLLFILWGALLMSQPSSDRTLVSIDSIRLDRNLPQLDLEVNSIFDNMALADSLDPTAIAQMVNMGELFRCAELDMEKLYAQMIHSIDWNLIMQDMDWNKFMEIFCDSSNQAYVQQNQQESPGVTPDQRHNISKCIKQGSLLDMMNAMDQDCINRLIITGKLKIFSMNKTGDMSSMCAMAECIDMNLMFKQTDWNCLFEQMDMGSVVQQLDQTAILEQLDSLDMSQEEGSVLNQDRDNPFFQFMNQEALQAQMQDNFQLFDLVEEHKLMQCMYEQVFAGRLKGETDRERFAQLANFSFSMMRGLYGDSRSLKYYIVYHHLIFESLFASDSGDVDRMLEIHLLQKDIILTAYREQLFDQLQHDMGSVRKIVGHNFELDQLAKLFENLSLFRNQLGQYRRSIEHLEYATAVRNHLAHGLAEPNQWDDILHTDILPSDRPMIKQKLIALYRVTILPASASKTPDDHIFQHLFTQAKMSVYTGQHPEIIDTLIQKGEIDLALDTYLLFKDMIREIPRGERISPDFLPLNLQLEPMHGLKMLKGIYHNMAKIMALSHQGTDSLYQHYLTVPNRLDQLVQQQLKVDLYMKLGLTHRMIQNHEYSLDYHKQTWDQLKKLPNLDYLTFALPGIEFSLDEINNKIPIYVSAAQRLANNYIRLQEYEKAEFVLQEVMDTVRDKPFLGRDLDEQDLEREFFIIYASLGQMGLSKRDSAMAHVNFQKCLELSDEMDDMFAAIAHRNYGLYVLSVGREQAALPYFEKAESISREGNFTKGIIDALSNQAHLSARQESYAEALVQLQEAEEIASLVHDYLALFQLQYRRGTVYQAQDQQSEALAAFDQGITIIEDSIFGEFFQGLGSRQMLLEQSFACYSEAISTSLSLGQTERAFQYAQQLKARTFNDLLLGKALNTDAIPIELSRRKKVIQDSLAMLERRDFLAESGNRQGFDPKYSAEKGEFIRQLQIVETRIREYIYGKQFSPVVSLEDIQSALQNNQTLIEYVIGVEKVWAFVVRKESLKVEEIGEVSILMTSLQKWSSLSKDLPNTIDNGRLKRNFQLIRQGFYQALIEPLEEKKLLSENERLIIVPDGNLSLLPFNSLLRQDGTYLSDIYSSIHLAPSTSSFLYQQQITPQQNPEKELLLISKTDFSEYPLLDNFDPLDLTPLQESVRGIDLIEGEQVSAAHLSTIDLTAYPYIYLSTHGEVDPRSPELSYLALTDGPLSLYETFDLKLGNEVVVLSACETALGTFQRGAGMMNFTRSFLSAGAKSIVISLWQVDADATEKLMQFFFKHLAASPPSIALQQAQEELREWNQGQYSHPFYWSGFVLVGSG